jgi:hypothetical protein
VKLGAKTTSLFAMYTIIGTKTTSNPCYRYGWPSLYLFEGKNDTAKKAPRANHACKNGLFSAKFGAKMTSLFAMYTV